MSGSGEMASSCTFVLVYHLVQTTECAHALNVWPVGFPNGYEGEGQVRAQDNTHHSPVLDRHLLFTIVVSDRASRHCIDQALSGWTYRYVFIKSHKHTFRTRKEPKKPSAAYLKRLPAAVLDVDWSQEAAQT
ncbi:hypothetical protein OH76DRAFT_253439 [Lentinus brumalis]|uniref:Uncharacterized protein n=1 Tax=Lentinus brumalis TaxID=2498619 RepID=A0A371CLD3_9APHY|nr:hypothetical protein OH76DRAFT_253439 [Polyporus brumalis]